MSNIRAITYRDAIIQSVTIAEKRVILIIIPIKSINHIRLPISSIKFNI